METSPLIQAHTHATRAAQLTCSSTQALTPGILKDASKEHSLAAELFSEAVNATIDPEARRTLELMREHHQKLAQALSDASSTRAAMKVSGSAGGGANTPILIRSGSPGPMHHSETPTLRRGGSSNTESDFPQGFPPLPHHAQAATRLGKSTSSLLVSNLASKRGIPMQNALSPVLSPATTPGTSVRRGNDFFTSNTQLNQHLDAQRAPITATPIPSKNLRAGQQPSRIEGNKQPEAGFNRFYTSLETFVSRIGSPLAGPLGFAGMDLGSESKESKESSPTHDGELIDGSTVPAHTDKEGYSYAHGVTEMVQNLMPKAWWSGQDQGQSKPTANTKGIFGGARTGGALAWKSGSESYYVVPQSKSGQALPISYAAIAGRSTSPPQDVAEDFSPLRPKKTDGNRRRLDAPATETIPEGDEGAPDGENSKTMEELILENQQLRHLTDTLSRRLHTWEVNARDSRAMLDRSLMLYRNKSGEGGSFGSTNSDAEKSVEKERELQREVQTLNAKMTDLETELENMREQLEKEKQENERSTKKANYYKERWDKLKMDAMAKEARKQQEMGTGLRRASLGETSSSLGETS